MKIGILTFHKSINYGAYLQAFALSQVIQARFPSDEVEIIDYDMWSARKYYLKEWAKACLKGNGVNQLKMRLAFQKAWKELPLSKIRCTSDDHSDFQKLIRGTYDVIVAGSDQVWKISGIRPFPNPYFLPGEGNIHKFSYAASSRSDMSKMSREKQQALETLLRDFRYIGVRDQKTADEIGKVIPGLPMHQNGDPTFLYDFGEAKESAAAVLKKYYGIEDDKPRIVFMVKNDRMIRAVKAYYGDRVHCISLFVPHKGTLYHGGISPFEFASVIFAADYMVTSFFHGMCFAIKAGVPFAAAEEKVSESQANSKMMDLLMKLGLEDRYASKSDTDSEKRILEDMERSLPGRVRLNHEEGIAALKASSESFFAALQAVKGERK